MKVCKDEPPSLKSHNPEIPDEVEKIVLKAMAKEKIDRYATAQALADDLKRFLTNQEIEAKGPSSLKLAAKRVKRNVWPLVVTAIVLVAGGVIAVLAMRPQPKPVVVEKPPPVNPNPNIVIAPEDTAGKKAAEWYAEWIKLSEALDYDEWKPGEAGLAARVNKHLLTLKADAPLRQPDVYDWFDRQTNKVETQVGRLGGAGEEKRSTASHIVAWVDMIQAAGKGVDYLKRPIDGATKPRADAARIANYKGSFTLKIFVGPYAEITKLTRNGKDVPLSQKVTPLTLGGLEIGDFEIELTHPTLGKRVEKISEKQLKDGKSFQISGRIQDAKLRVTELP
jgi:hypothetical protein